MKPNKSEVQSQFREIYREKLAAWDAKHIPPAPPTVKQVREDIRRGRARIKVPCGCNLAKRIRYEHAAPDLEDVLSQVAIYPQCVEFFLAEAKRFFKRRHVFHEALRESWTSLQNDALYGGKNFVEALDKMKAFKV